MNDHLMYQVNVLDAKGRQIPIGPKFSTKPAAEQLAYMTRQAIATDRLHGWHEPTVVTLIAVEN
jgi:hypothetical protein